jgi:hypothetical protein
LSRKLGPRAVGRGALRCRQPHLNSTEEIALARAKNTTRADARRRTREAQRAELNVDEAADAQEPTDDAPATARPALFKMPNFREDIRLLPSLFRTRRLLWLPLAIFLSGLVLVLIIGALPTDIGGIADLYLQFFFVPPALFTFFIAGFVAPRASYLVGFIYGVIGGLTWFIGLVPSGAVTDLASFASAFVTTLMYGVVYGTLAAAFAAWYRDFLRRMQDNSRKKRVDQEAKERAKRRDERQEARKVAKRTT